MAKNAGGAPPPSGGTGAPELLGWSETVSENSSTTHRLSFTPGSFSAG